MDFPHASVISQEVMERGMIQSVTDYEVYTKAGIPGVDFGLIENRWVYHTDDDAEPLLNDRTIEHMGSSVMAIVIGIANQPAGINSLCEKPEVGHLIFADIFGLSMWTASYSGFGMLGVTTVLVYIAAWLPNKISRIKYRKNRFSGVFREFVLVLGATMFSACTSLVVVLNALSISPLAVSSRPYLILLLTLFSNSFGTVIYIQGIHGLFLINPQRIQQQGLASFWIFALILVSLSCFRTVSFLVYVYWYGLMYFIHSFILSSIASLKEILSRKVCERRRYYLPPCRINRSVSYIPLLRYISKWPSAGLFSQFTMTVAFPGLINMDLALLVFNGLSYTVQENTSPLLISGLSIALVVPIAINAMPIWASLNVPVRRLMCILLGILVISLSSFVTMEFPAHSRARVKFYMWVQSQARGNLAISSGLETSSMIEIPIKLIPGLTRVNTHYSHQAPPVPNFFEPNSKAMHAMHPNYDVISLPEEPDFPHFFVLSPTAYVQVADGELNVHIRFPPQLIVNCDIDPSLATKLVVFTSGSSKQYKVDQPLYVHTVSSNATTEFRYTIPNSSITHSIQLHCYIQSNSSPWADKVYRRALKNKPKWVSISTTGPLARYKLTLNIEVRHPGTYSLSDMLRF
jgi:hypothetical protein